MTWDREIGGLGGGTLRLRVGLRSALRRREGSWWRGAVEGGRLLRDGEGEGRLWKWLGRREQERQGGEGLLAAGLRRRGMGYGGQSRESWRRWWGERGVAC